MRFTVAFKLWIGFGILIFLLTVTSLIVIGNIRLVERALQKITNIEEPTSAASYEMEINVVGTGLGVLQYLETGEAQYRARVEKDESDFRTFKLQYDRLGESEREHELGARIDSLYGEFNRTGKELMQQRDQRETAFKRVAQNSLQIEEIISNDIQPRIDTRTTLGLNQMLASERIIAGVAEAEAWLGDHVHVPSAADEARIARFTEDVRRSLSVFKSLSLDEAKRRLAIEVETIFEQTIPPTREVVALDNAMLANIERFMRLRADLDRVLDEEIQVLTHEHLNLANTDARRTVRFIQIVIIVMLGFSLMVGVGAAIKITHGIVVPVRKLVEGASKIGSGVLEHRIALTTDDEIGDLAMAFNDMAEKRQSAETALRESEEHYRLQVEGVRDYAIFMLDRHGRVASWNMGAERIKEFTAKEIIGQHYSRFFPDESVRAGEPERVLKQAATEGRFEGEGWRVRKDGTRFIANVVVTALYDDAGNLRGYSKLTRDITARKRNEDALAQQARELSRSNAELERFAYVASHDLQEPLRMVASYTQLLSKRYKGKLDASADEFIAYAVDGAVRMQHLISDLLAYSRVGTKGEEFTECDSTAAFDCALYNLQIAIEESGAIVTRDELPTVCGDDVELCQVFQNLIGNAIKFRAADTPRVHVSANLHDADWVFSVRDNGIGISPEYAERIFVVFQRLHGKTEYPGTGIGLAICEKIVARHGGRIWVESQPGDGATFYFTLPQQNLCAKDN